MKKTEVIEILDYMFEFLFSSAEENGAIEIDDKTIKQYLTDAGFDNNNIENALTYLKNMATEVEVKSFNENNTSIRFYSPEEKNKIGVSGIGLLTYLDNINAINQHLRELIIDHIMSLPYLCTANEVIWLIQYATMNVDNKDLANMLSDHYDCYENKNGTRH